MDATRETFPINTFVSVGTDEPYSGLVVGYDLGEQNETVLVVAVMRQAHPKDCTVVPSRGARVPLLGISVEKGEERWAATARHGSRSWIAFGSTENESRQKLYRELCLAAAADHELVSVLFGD